MRTVLRRPVVTAPAAFLAALLGLLLVLVAPPARAADSGLDAASSALKSRQVYVDPAMTSRFSEAQADALSKKIKDADKPIFVAVVPGSKEYAAATVVQDLRTKTGIVGVYLVWRDNGMSVFSDPQVLSRNATNNIGGAAYRSHPGDINGAVNDFVDQAAQQARGHAPSGGTSALTYVLVGVVILLLLGGVVFLFLRARKRKEDRQRAELAQVRGVVDEDLTAFGEELTRLDFNPAAPGVDDAQRSDYTHALDAYDRAKKAIDAAKSPQDVHAVTVALEDGRFALATLAARRDGRPLPERRVPCFFDPRHGPSVKDIDWAPAGGATRQVPVCADDAQRLANGLDPEIRHVQTPYGRQPYWDAGPAYAPWAGGYFGSGALTGLLVGTALGAVLASSGEAWGYEGGYEHHGYQSYDNGVEGGDYSGADFNGGGAGTFGDFGGDSGFSGGGGGGDDSWGF